MRLYLMRHGIANDVSQDPEQGLSDSGKSEVLRLADMVRHKHVSFGQVQHSPKKRAQQTAEIMRQTVSPEAVICTHDNIKPNDDPAILIRELNSLQDGTLVVSHLPYLPDLLHRLTKTNDIVFHPATLVCISSDAVNNWKIDWLASP